MTSSLQTFTVYYNGPSPNPFKVALVLEELGLPWKFETVESEKLKEEPYVSINPNGRVPALVDPNKNITLWEVSLSMWEMPLDHGISALSYE